MAFSFTGFLRGLLIQNEVDRTKQLIIQSSASATTGTSTTLTNAQTANRTLTLPDATDILTANAATQTLTNKTLGSTNTATGITMASFTPDGTNTLTAPTTTDTLTANAATQTLTNKSISGLSNTLTNIATTSLTGTLQAAQFPALTGDVTTTAGSLSSTVAKIQGTTVSGTTGSSNVVFSSAPTLTNPIVGTQAQLDGSTKAASTSYVDTAVANAVAGLNPAVAVQAATTAASDTSGFTYNNGVSGIGATFTGSVNTAVTIDGYTFTTLGQRLLVKNDTQSPSGAFNGIYYVTQLQTSLLAPILTRSLDYDQPSDINNTGAIPVVNGTVNGTTSWVQTAQIVTVGTTPLVFVKFSRNPADYLLAANNLSDVASKSTSFNNLSPMTTQGDIIYGGTSGTGTRLGVGSTGNVLTVSSGGIPSWQASSGGGGSKNYLSVYTASTSGGTANTGNGNFEFGSTTGWSLGTTGTLTNGLPTGSPTFGSGASGNLSISTVSGGSQIGGSYSLSYASSAATTAGNMVASNAFYIDAEDQGKVLTVKFYYSVPSNPSNGNFSGTSSDSFAWAIYDVTNSNWLGTAGQFGTAQNSGTGYVTGTFQTAINTAQLRFVLYNANASSGAITLYVDDISVGPQTAPLGPAMTDWVPYTPTFTGFGTVSSTFFYSRRVGDSLEVLGQFTSGTPTAVANQITLGYNGINSNVTISSSSTKINESVVGIAAVNQVSATTFSWVVNAITGNGYVSLGIQNSTNASAVNTQNGSTVVTTSGVYMTVHFVVPIQGWSSNVNMSSDTDTRVVAFQANPQTPTGTLTSSYNIAKFGTVTNDTHGGYNTSTGLYTIPVTGYYNISSTIDLSYASSAAGNYVTIEIQANSVGVGNGTNKTLTTGSGEYQTTATTIAYCTAGQTIGVYVATTLGTPAYASGFNGSTLSINRLSGPAVVAATESVNASYFASGTQSIPNNADTTITILTSKIFDTHNAFNSGTGTYTIPVAGKYRASLAVATNGNVAASGVNNSFQAGLQQGGSAATAFLFAQQATTLTAIVYMVQIEGTFNCLAGDTIKPQTYTALTGSAVTIGNTAIGWGFCIERVGN